MLPVHPWLRVWNEEGRRDYFFELSFPYGGVSGGNGATIGYLSMILGATLILSERVTLLHGALVQKGGQASALIGPSGRGKTTAAHRIGPPWRAISDD